MLNKSHQYKRKSFIAKSFASTILFAFSLPTFASSVFTASSGPITNTTGPFGSGFGVTKLEAMSASCRDFRDDSYYVEATQRLECPVQEDGVRYRCTDGTGGIYCSVYTEVSCASDNATSSYCSSLPMKNSGCSAGNNKNLEGNPCNVATGNKIYQQKIVESAIPLILIYNSQDFTADVLFGKGWSSNLFKRLTRFSDKSIAFTDGTGRTELFNFRDGVWVGDADSKFRLIAESSDQFAIEKNEGGKISFDLSVTRYPLLETFPQGRFLQYQYSYNRGSLNQTEITNHDGHSLLFRYRSNGRIRYVEDAAGVLYFINHSGQLGTLLDNIVFAHTGPQTVDGKTKYFHYEQVNGRSLLTGITDENGNRYATYSYDENGKAISTEHAPTTNGVGQEKFELDYQ